MKQTYQMKPIHWALTIAFALFFHHSASASGISPQKLHESFGALELHGLKSSAYQSKLDMILANSSDEQMQMNLNGFVTDLVADLRFGATRTKPMKAESEQAMEISQIVSQLNHCSNLPVCYQAIAARHQQYQPLQQSLAEYKTIEQRGGWPKIAAGATLKPGMRDARVSAVTTLLVMTGDYEGTSPSMAYDDALVAAVKQFQTRHGLDADGAVGPATLQAMNMPVEKRISQLELSLERLRKLPNETGHYIRVNVPSYQLHAFDNDKEVLTMNVVVGQKSRPTPLFDNHINTLVMNPTWTPTTKILREDILPKVRNNPDYITNGNYVVTDRYTGETLDPYSVDWQSASAADVHVMQKAGAKNALGKIKFLLPDNDSVYLHDTSHPELFSKSYRALSSGCIRLSDPKALLEYVSSAQSKPEFTKAVDYYQGSTSRTLKVDQPIHVKMTYFTAWVDEAGRPTFYDDVYKKDARLELALTKQDQQYAAR